MGHLINIAYQGGTHGNFLRYCIDRYSELTDPISELPFTINTSHKRLNYSKLITQYHPNIKEPYFKNTDEPHILITVNKNDLLFIERWVTIRASNFNINTNNNKIQLQLNKSTTKKIKVSDQQTNHIFKLVINNSKIQVSDQQTFSIEKYEFI